ncbi:MAG: VWA domain-containing protein [Acidobacteria bacterium]|nr:VWA domain-containing protein [Acidobacteriota bacterium]
MRQRKWIACGVLVVLAVLGNLAAPPVCSQQRPEQPTFRSRITIVPVDIRVIDANGKAITGLKAEDFTVLEDGMPQKIGHFSEHVLTPETPEPGAQPMLRQAESADLTLRKQRIFLIVLGRGRLQEPSKGMDALLRFVRKQLLPQDQVAVLAYNRATDFTTDHEKVAQTLERFRRGHEKVEALIVQQFDPRSLQAHYGSKEISPSTQQLIDEMLHGPGTAPVRKLPPAPVTAAARLAEDARRDTDDLQRAEIASSHGELKSVFDETTLRDAERFDVTLEQYVSGNIRAAQDLTNIYTGIEYMRYLQGEKHLIFVTEEGVMLPRLEDDFSIAAMANDARVVLDTIQTGGIPGPPPPGVFGSGASLSSQLDQSAKRGPGPSLTQLSALATLKTVLALTGGVSSRMADANQALNRINEVTLSGYLLGYYPTNANWNGKYRRIEIKVNRPGATVLFRHGYYGRGMVVPLNRRAFLTFNRVAAAGYYDRDMRDIPITVKASMRKAPDRNAAGEAFVDIRIDLSGVPFETEGDRHVAALDIAVFCGSEKEDLVGESWEKADLRLKEETYQRLLKEGFLHTTRVTLKAPARYSKVVVYDYRSDRLGSAVIKVK